MSVYNRFLIVCILYWLPEGLHQVCLNGSLVLYTLFFIGTALSTVVNRFRFDSRARSKSRLTWNQHRMNTYIYII